MAEDDDEVGTEVGGLLVLEDYREASLARLRLEPARAAERTDSSQDDVKASLAGGFGDEVLEPGTLGARLDRRGGAERRCAPELGLPSRCSAARGRTFLLANLRQTVGFADAGRGGGEHDHEERPPDPATHRAAV